MASKGPKSDAPTKPAAKSAPATSKTAKPVAAPVAAKAVKAPVTPPVATTPVAAPVATTPAVTPAVAKPAAAKPVAAKVVAAPKAPAPVAAAPKPAPVPAPVAAPVAVAPVAVAPVAAAPVAAAPALPVIDPITPAAEVAPAAKASTPPVKKVTIMENTIHTATEKTQALFVDMNERTKAAMEKSTQMFADMNDLNKGNVEALVESSKIAAKAIETMSQEAAEFTRKTLEGATTAMRNMASVKTPADFMKLQTEFVRTAFDSMVAETSKNTEAMLKMAGDVAQPISNRVAVAAEKIKLTA